MSENNQKYNVIGKPLPRIDGFDKVTGKARYAADIYMNGMLYAGALKSGHVSAKVLSINTEKAKTVPGVAAVVTFKDLPKMQSFGSYMYLTDVIRFSGDCVAMVAAENRYALQEALESIEVEYEELPVVSTIEEAMAPGAYQLHDKYPGNIFTLSRYDMIKGDVENAWEEADVILEREYRTQYVEHAYIEPEAVVAFEDANMGNITVHASTQNPFSTRRYVSDLLGLPFNRVRIIQEHLGGSFGGKDEMLGIVAARTAYLAKLTKRPVKYVFSREDSILESGKRHPFRLRYKVGVKKDGKIVAWEGEQVDNSGAYTNQTQFMNWRANVHSAGAYEIENIKTKTFGVFTNNSHSGAMRGYSSPQLLFAQEQLIDELADAIGMDEITFRQINCLKSGSKTASGTVVSHVNLEEIMVNLVEKTDYRKKRESYKNQDGRIRKGIGIAINHRGCGLGAESPDASGCMMIINSDGSVTINSGLAENGQGLKTAYAQIAAESLGVKFETVQFYGTDTHMIPDCGLTVASRGTFMGAQPVKRAGDKLKQIMLGHALEMEIFDLREIENVYGLQENSLSYDQISKEDIELCQSQFYLKKYPDVKIELKGISDRCFWSGRQLSVFEWFTPERCTQSHETGQGTPFPCYGYGCVVAEVEVDMATGYVDVKKVTSGLDTGNVINPALLTGQLYGGIVMGQGFSVMEEVTDVKGKVTSKNLDSYILPTSLDAPEMDVYMFDSGDPTGTYGAKSIGEPATEAVGAAIANAISNAIGRRIYQNPCDLEQVLLGKKLR